MFSAMMMRLVSGIRRNAAAARTPSWANKTPAVAVQQHERHRHQNHRYHRRLADYGRELAHELETACIEKQPVLNAGELVFKETLAPQHPRFFQRTQALLQREQLLGAERSALAAELFEPPLKPALLQIQQQPHHQAGDQARQRRNDEQKNDQGRRR